MVQSSVMLSEKGQNSTKILSNRIVPCWKKSVAQPPPLLYHMIIFPLPPQRLSYYGGMDVYIFDTLNNLSTQVRADRVNPTVASVPLNSRDDAIV